MMFVCFAFAKAQSHQSEILSYQQEQNQKFKDSEKSPLTQGDRKSFKGLPFFPIDSSYRITARYEQLVEPYQVKFPTTTRREAVYLAFAKAIFTLNGKKQELILYFSPSLARQKEYQDYLFIPFTDPTNGEETYGGGRYLEGRIPDADIIVLDFNKAYNPYCAYNPRYSCPIVPQENQISEPVKAGVQYQPKTDNH